MSKTNIDWCINPDGTQGYVWNPIKGCNGLGGKQCSYCYGKRYVKRGNYAHKVADAEIEYLYGSHWPVKVKGLKHYRKIKNFILRYKPHFFEYCYAQKLRKKPTMYFFSMSDPADWEQGWYEKIVEKIRQYPQHRFAVLTKRPQIYKKYQFLENVWCGVTIACSKIIDRPLRQEIMEGYGNKYFSYYKLGKEK